MHSEMQAVNEHCYGSLAEVQRFSEVPSGTPLFFSEYVFENYPMDETILEGMPGLAISEFRAVEKTNYPLGLMAAPGPPLTVKALYDVDSFSRDSIERMLGHVRAAVEWIVENGSSALADAALMPPEEQELLARKWSGAEVAVPRAGQSIVELFRQRATEGPERPAILCEEERLTYGQLLDYVVFAVLIFYALTIFGLFRLRKNKPELERPYKAFGYPVIPLIYILLALIVMIILFIYKPGYTWPGLCPGRFGRSSDARLFPICRGPPQNRLSSQWCLPVSAGRSSCPRY